MIFLGELRKASRLTGGSVGARQLSSADQNTVRYGSLAPEVSFLGASCDSN